MAYRSPLTASAVDRAFLSPGMDARAHNLDQYDPSPGVDSQLERIRALALRLPPSLMREALLDEIDAAIASNRSEGHSILDISGAADQLITDLRRLEKNNGAKMLGAKAIARHVREPLAHLLNPQDCSPRELTDARRILLETIAEVPRLMLLSPTVEHELGRQRFAALRRFANKGGAVRSASVGASARSEASEHEQA
jgi:hypothetical protein